MASIRRLQERQELLGMFLRACGMCPYLESSGTSPRSSNFRSLCWRMESPPRRLFFCKNWCIGLQQDNVSLLFKHASHYPTSMMYAARWTLQTNWIQQTVFLQTGSIPKKTGPHRRVLECSALCIPWTVASNPATHWAGNFALGKERSLSFEVGHDAFSAECLHFACASGEESQLLPLRWLTNHPPGLECKRQPHHA